MVGGASGPCVVSSGHASAAAGAQAACAARHGARRASAAKLAAPLRSEPEAPATGCCTRTNRSLALPVRYAVLLGSRRPRHHEQEGQGEGEAQEERGPPLPLER